MEHLGDDVARSIPEKKTQVRLWGALRVVLVGINMGMVITSGNYDVTPVTVVKYSLPQAIGIAPQVWIYRYQMHSEYIDISSINQK